MTTIPLHPSAAKPFALFARNLFCRQTNDSFYEGDDDEVFCEVITTITDLQGIALRRTTSRVPQQGHWSCDEDPPLNDVHVNAPLFDGVIAENTITAIQVLLWDDQDQSGLDYLGGITVIVRNQGGVLSNPEFLANQHTAGGGAWPDIKTVVFQMSGSGCNYLVYFFWR